MCLEFADHLAEGAGGEEAGAERAGGVGAQGWEGAQGCSGFGGEVRELPAHFGGTGVGVVRVCQLDGPRGVGGGAESMCAQCATPAACAAERAAAVPVGVTAA